MSTYDDELDDDNKEREDSRRENFEEYYEQPLQVRLEDARNEDIDFPDYDDDDDTRRKITPQMIAVLVAVAIVVIVIICFIVVAVKNHNKQGGETKEQETSTVEETLPSELEGYKVIGQIKIEKIGCEQYILDATDDKALEAGVGKLYGGVLNSIGNVSIVGHDKDDKFGKLDELSNGDTFVIIDKNNKETTYKITNIETVEPDNLEVLLPGEGKAEITLITCESGSTKRLIVKAIKTSTQSINNSGTSGTNTTSTDGQ